jgi:hypothetical protein
MCRRQYWSGLHQPDMADLPTYPDSSGDTGEDTTGTPSWVYVLGIIAIVLLLLFVILHLTVGGPGGHTT